MTQVNWTRQLGLAILLVVLATGAFWLEFKHRPKQEEKEELSKKIFQLKDTPVQSIALANGAQSISMTCSDFATKLCKAGDHSKWELTEPTKLRADDSNANSLLSALNQLNSSETIDLKNETPEKRSALLKEYGLDSTARKTAARVKIVTASGPSVLYLGAPHPIGENLFSLEELGGKVDESRVYLIPSYFKANLDHDVTYWRDKKVLTLGAHEVESFKIEGSKAKNLSATRKVGQWALRSEVGELPGDTETIDSLLSTLTYLSAKSFPSDSKTDAKATSLLKGIPAVLKITLQKEKGSAKEAPAPDVLTFFRKKSNAPSEKVYVTVSSLDPLFELEPNTIDRLDKSAKDLRLTKLLTSSDKFSVQRLEFEGGTAQAKPWNLVRSEGKWLRSEDKSEVSAEKVSSLLEKLSGKRIQDFLTASKIPSGDKNELKLNIQDNKNAVIRNLIFWKDAGKLYAKDQQSKRNEAYLLDDTLMDALPWEPNLFQKEVKKPNPTPSGHPSK